MLPGKEKATVLPAFKKDKDTPMLAPFPKGIFEVPLKKGGIRGLSSPITGTR